MWNGFTVTSPGIHSGVDKVVMAATKGAAI